MTRRWHNSSAVLFRKIVFMQNYSFKPSTFSNLCWVILTGRLHITKESRNTPHVSPVLRMCLGANDESAVKRRKKSGGRDEQRFFFRLHLPHKRSRPPNKGRGFLTLNAAVPSAGGNSQTRHWCKTLKRDFNKPFTKTPFIWFILLLLFSPTCVYALDAINASAPFRLTLHIRTPTLISSPQR